MKSNLDQLLIEIGFRGRMRVLSWIKGMTEENDLNNKERLCAQLYYIINQSEEYMPEIMIPETSLYLKYKDIEVQDYLRYKQSKENQKDHIKIGDYVSTTKKYDDFFKKHYEGRVLSIKRNSSTKGRSNIICIIEGKDGWIDINWLKVI